MTHLLLNFLSITAIVLPVFYVILMLNYLRGWRQLPRWEIPQAYQPKTKIDVIVPARNEESHLGACLNSILKTSYPSDLLSIIIVDDHSSDQTAAIASDFVERYPQVRLIQLAEQPEQTTTSFKKQALATGIASGTGDLIICTDADCEVPASWLHFFSSYYEEKEAVFMAAPVNFHREKTVLERFQSLDFIGMMLITGAGIQQSWMHMSNGANLAYSRAAYLAVNGFQGIDHLASGDDMLLMQKMVKAFPGRIGFIKNRLATVHSIAQSSWFGFFQQRIRWASKSSAYPEWKITLTLAGVFFTCWMLLISIPLAIWDPSRFLGLFLFQLAMKSGVDYLFLKTAAQFFDRQNLLRIFWPAQFLHICYIAVVGLLANLFKTYEWKGRKVR